MGQGMQTTKLRQQGGAMILTISRETARRLGWHVGDDVKVEESEHGLNIEAVKRRPRGTFTVEQLLSQIDSDELRQLNDDVKGFADLPKGNETW